MKKIFAFVALIATTMTAANARSCESSSDESNYTLTESPTLEKAEEGERVVYVYKTKPVNTSEPRMILGVHGGLSLTKFTPMEINTFFMDEGDWEHSFNPGANIGFSYEVAMHSRRKFYFETGLELLLLQGTSKCYDWLYHGYYNTTWGLKRKVDYCGVQAIVPLMFNYKIKINDNWKICPRFGLQVEIGIKGNEKIKKGDYDDRYDHYDLYSSDEGTCDMFHEGDWMPAGFSGRVGVNCQYKRLTFGADFVGRMMADNIGFNFNVGYNLWSK